MFYYVAKYRGIAKAARNMPYGIQRPAISKQMLAFEEELGHRLFSRDPFRLTAVGERVAARATALIEGILDLTKDLKGEGIHWRVCSSEWVLEKQVSGLITFLHRHDVKTTFQLTPTGPSQMERWLAEDTVDLAIGVIHEPLHPAVDSEPLAEIPLALFVPKGKDYAHIKSADYFWAQASIKEPLVCPTPKDVLVGRRFMEELERRNIEWPIYIGYGSMAPVIRYVADGHGVGVAPNFPPLLEKAAVRVLPLPSFPRITIGAMWQKAAERPRISLEIMRRMAREVCPEYVVPSGTAG